MLQILFRPEQILRIKLHIYNSVWVRKTHAEHSRKSILNNRNLFVYNSHKEVAMEKNGIRTPHWIHDTTDDPNSVTGKKYLVSCTCSECGYHANMEKPVCPQCKAKMKWKPCNYFRRANMRPPYSRLVYVHTPEAKGCLSTYIIKQQCSISKSALLLFVSQCWDSKKPAPEWYRCVY